MRIFNSDGSEPEVCACPFHITTEYYSVAELSYPHVVVSAIRSDSSVQIL
jgi:hypothetical protein